ncbi:unnamed protein product [Clonostachys byssicola]|uniref:Uncharacterized protein n=1 Tax=Clonostachys byssicola TaxID=160290 RepID=A0A9N9UL89_9HYPO|nr:unnamed protein product [Clonostachys byssicola]
MFSLLFPGLPVEYCQVASRDTQRLEFLHDLIVGEVLLSDDLVKMVTAIRILLNRIPAFDGVALTRHQRSQVLLRDDVLMHPVEQTLDQAELDKAADVDVAQHLEPSFLVGPEPLDDGAPGNERGHEPDEVEIAEAASAMGDVLGAFVDHAVDVFHEIMDTGSGRIAGSEEEHVEEQNGVVVEEVAERCFGQVHGDVSSMGDAPDVRHTVDMGNYFLKGEIPGWVDNIGKFGFRDWDVPAFDGWWVGILILLFHLRKGRSKPPYHGFVGSLVNICLDKQAEVEDEFVPHILSVRDENGVPQDGVLALWAIYGDIAIAEGLARDDVFMKDVKVDKRGPRIAAGVAAGCRRVDRCDAARRRLSDNLRTWKRNCECDEM